MINYNFIKTRQEGYVFYLTLARSAKRNAFTVTMVNEIEHALQQANAAASVKLVILEAEGPIFCAGMDLKNFKDPSIDQFNPALENKDISLGEVMDRLDKPSIAVVKGDVIAGGFLLILGCSYVYASKEVRFKLPELALGIFPFQVMASLLKVMPEKKVLQRCLHTDFFDVESAIRDGIVDGIFTEERLAEHIASFEAIENKPMQAGIKALKALKDLPKEKHFAFLKQQLDALEK